MDDITKTIIDGIMEHQASKPDKEVCGFIIEQDGRKFCWPMTNITDDDDFFILDPRQTYEVFVSMNPIAVYHTHPKGDHTPSDLDKRTAKLACLPMWIVDKDGNLNIYDEN